MRVLGDGGTGSTGGILAALDSVAAVVSDGRLQGPTVVSMSRGGPCQSRDVTFCAERSFYANAISDLRSMGVLVVVAAGNDGADACRTVPRRCGNQPESIRSVDGVEVDAMIHHERTF